MELNEDLLDTVDLTARLRRHPRFGDLREGLRAEGVEPDTAYLLTLDGVGADRGLGLLLDANAEALEFQFEGFQVELKVVDAGSDPLIAQTRATIQNQGSKDQLERAILEFPGLES